MLIHATATTEGGRIFVCPQTKNAPVRKEESNGVAVVAGGGARLGCRELRGNRVNSYFAQHKNSPPTRRPSTNHISPAHGAPNDIYARGRHQFDPCVSDTPRATQVDHDHAVAVRVPEGEGHVRGQRHQAGAGRERQPIGRLAHEEVALRG